MILIITGPPASGKTTVGPLIAKRLKRCVVIDVDWLRAMVVQPHVPAWEGEEGRFQLHLGAQNGCILACNCVAAGFDVVVLDVLTDATAHIYRARLLELEHQIVLLLPSLAESLRRNRERGQYLTDEEVELLYAWESELSEFDHKIDNTHIAAEKLAQELSTSFFQA